MKKERHKGLHTPSVLFCFLKCSIWNVPSELGYEGNKYGDENKDVGMGCATTCLFPFSRSVIPSFDSLAFSKSP